MLYYIKFVLSFTCGHVLFKVKNIDKTKYNISKKYVMFMFLGFSTDKLLKNSLTLGWGLHFSLLEVQVRNSYAIYITCCFSKNIIGIRCHLIYLPSMFMYKNRDMEYVINVNLLLYTLTVIWYYIGSFHVYFNVLPTICFHVYIKSCKFLMESKCMDERPFLWEYTKHMATNTPV